ncbi:MAG TPA: patatin-like phospholipase family protein [Gammaproteobacteria bacterium]|nr:patatin-like phospholipase family protein [Gammaproteobacteria bacterium]
MQRTSGFLISSNPDSESEYRFTYFINPPPIRVISFKGGGARVVVYTKFVELAHERGLLENVEEIGGSSSGCIASAFAAIHYEDPHKRTEVLDEISRLKKEDVYGHTKGWKAYRIMSFPLNIIAKPSEWAAEGINWVSDKLNKNSLKLIGYPLKFIAVLFRAISVIFSPKTYAAIINLFAGRGIYRGDVFQYHVREQLRKDTQAGLDAILNKLSLQERKKIGLDLVKKGICTFEQGNLKVVTDITCMHLYELSKLPGSQFKQYYTTAVRMRDKTMIVFNKDSAPNVPIHLLMRLAVTFPFYFKTKKYLGDKFLDGGIVDNSPVRHATEKSFPQHMHRYGVTDKLARLNVRVEYPDEQEYHIWNKRPDDQKRGVLFKIKRAITRFAAGGIDVFETNDETTAALQEDYSQRTLQIPDFGIGQLARKISRKQRERIDDELPNIVTDYFDNHVCEKAVVKNYISLKDIPSNERATLLACLADAEITNEEIFTFHDKTPEELTSFRSELIEQVKRSFNVFDDEFSDTSMIFRALRIKPTFTPQVMEDVKLGVKHNKIESVSLIFDNADFERNNAFKM